MDSLGLGQSFKEECENCKKTEEDNENLEYEIDSLRSQITELEDELSGVRYRKNDEISNLQYDISRLESDKADLQYRIDSLQSEIRNYESEVSQLKNNHYSGGYY